MSDNDGKKTIFKAILEAQKSFGPAIKNATNPHFRNNYADLSACINAVIDGFNKNGIALIQKTHECNAGVKVETIFLHESGVEYSAGVLQLPADKNNAQGYGSALTYARRYSLMAACGVVPEDDDGNAATSGAQQAQPQNEKQWLNPNTREWGRAIESYNQTGSLETVMQYYKISKQNQELIKQQGTK